MNRRTTPPAAPACDEPQDLPAPAAETGRGVFGPPTAMSLLFRKARAHLSDADLEWLFIDGSSYAEALAENAAVVAEGIGWLVHKDNAGAEHTSAGSFQSNADVPPLMFHMSNVFLQIASMVNVVAEAEVELRERGQS